MRIGVVAHDLDANTGGGYTFHQSVLRALQRTKTRHSIFVLAHGGVSEELGRSEGWTIVDVDNRYQDQAAAGRSPVQAAVDEMNLDLVWFLHPVCELLSVPIFATVWDLEHRKQPYFPEVSTSGWDWNTREAHYSTVLPRAARIFTGTSTGKDEIVHYYRVNEDNIFVNPFSVTDFLQDPTIREQKETIDKYSLKPNFLFYPAQFWPHKNHVNLLLALQCLEEDHGIRRDLVLTGYDAGNLDHVRAVVTDLGLDDQVRFLGFIPQREVAVLYRLAGALVYPSLFGPDNLPPLEAFAFGCPVVASNIKGAALEIGRAAALFDPTDPEDMAARIARVVADAELRQKMISRGIEIAVGRTPEAYVDKALKVVDDFEPYRRNWRNDFYCK